MANNLRIAEYTMAEVASATAACNVIGSAVGNRPFWDTGMVIRITDHEDNVVLEEDDPLKMALFESNAQGMPWTKYYGALKRVLSTESSIRLDANTVFVGIVALENTTLLYLPYEFNMDSPLYDENNQDGNRSVGDLTAPDNLVASPSDTEVDLTWSSVSGATDYEVRVDAGSWISTGNIVGYQFQGLTNGQLYSFDVRATNATEDGPTSSAAATPTDNVNALSGGYSALTVVSPETVSTVSRFGKAYPGLLYQVDVGVTGGYFPYKYTLTTAPVGMTIDLHTGVINWPDAQTDGNTYAVSVLVTDNNGDTVTKSWNIDVTTANFYFVDAINGSAANDGSIASPWQTLLDVFGSGDKFTTYIPDGIVYFRDGIYDLVGLPMEESAPDTRVPWYVNRKASKFIAYPNESPEFNFNTNGADSYLSLQFSEDDFFCDGIDFNNNNNQRGKTVSCSPANHWVFRNNNWRGLTTQISGGNNSHLFFSGGTGQYAHVRGNTKLGDDIGYFMLHYATQNVLVDNNVLSGDCVLPLGPKSGIVNCTYRENDINCSGVSTAAIWLQEFSHSEGFEVCFNNIRLPTSTDTAVRLLGDASCGGVQVFRNTLVGHVEVASLDSNKGPWVFDGNVIINDSPESDKITRVDVTDANQLIVTNNLVGVAADTIVDVDGNLTASYQDQLGQVGHKTIEVV